MPGFEFEKVLELRPGDELLVTTLVRSGDVVRFDRVSDARVEMRALAAEEAAVGDGPLYRVSANHETGTFEIWRER